MSHEEKHENGYKKEYPEKYCCFLSHLSTETTENDL